MISQEPSLPGAAMFLCVWELATGLEIWTWTASGPGSALDGGPLGHVGTHWDAVVGPCTLDLPISSPSGEHLASLALRIGFSLFIPMPISWAQGSVKGAVQSTPGRETVPQQRWGEAEATGHCEAACPALCGP